MTLTNLAISTENAKKPLFNLTGEELLQMFDQVVKANLREIYVPPIVPSNSNKNTEEHFNYAEAVAFCKISKPTFGILRREGKIKGIQVSKGRVLFNRSDLEAYLQSTHE
jgi:hypothetical protein